MPHISLTRLRIRSVRYLPLFAIDAIRSKRQVERAPGFLTGALLPDRQWTFWTMTAWDSPESMRAYMLSGAHKAAMPRLMHWCDEASVAHWSEPEADLLSLLPSWTEADHRMRTTGRPSKVLHPSPQQAASAHGAVVYRAPRTTVTAPIHRA